ncbi:MAG: ATP-dependent sacrificial sulfur transferase LarE [Spirochaetaceae bacterium]|nr:ATP-dependent sacrificial sulfur transferase LarE [Spirochaetaceae bacterium]
MNSPILKRKTPALSLDEKYNKLLACIAAHGSAAVAFSGGVDSSFLCYAAKAALGNTALAITIDSPLHPRSEIACAAQLSRQIGIEHIVIEEEGLDARVAANPKDRCYHCKKIVFGKILLAAKERGLAAVLDGSNTDDLNDYRPGMKALEELGIASPLKEAGMAKADIRELSRRFGLPTWDKPAFACLASRIPYGEPISKEGLARVEKAEEALAAYGFRQMRVRVHGSIARIEVAPEERKLFFNEETLDAVSRDIKACGFAYVAFELEGYKTGSLNKEI